MGGGWALLGLQLRTHLKGYAGPEGVPSHSVGALGLHLLDAVDVVSSQVWDAVQRSRCKTAQGSALSGEWSPQAQAPPQHMRGTLGALQAIGGHAELGSQVVEHSGGAFDGVHQEQRPLRALHRIEPSEGWALGVHKQGAQVQGRVILGLGGGCHLCKDRI